LNVYGQYFVDLNYMIGRLTAAFLAITLTGFAQVGEIKSKSASNGGRSGRSEGNSGGGFGYFFFNFIGSGLVDWQRASLQKRGEVPMVLSLEAFGQAAIQPSSYYIFLPRVRGNWGIFFSDFRMNYLLEESIGGAKELATFDWQIIGLNVVNNKNVTARIGTGMMTENFGEHRSFSESTLGLTVQSADQKMGVTAEYRWAKNFDTGSVPRREWSLSGQRKLFDSGILHGFATGGFLFQRYYSDVNVWGLQGGFALKLY
jgi:hypothetical protein